MSTSQVTQAQQTISPPPSQDYSHCASGTIQAHEGEMNIHSENGQTDAVLTENTGMCYDISVTMFSVLTAEFTLCDVTLHAL